MNKRVANIIQRLEVRRMESDGWSAIWCPSCFRCVVSRQGDARAKSRPTAIIDDGDEACGKTMAHGSINDCIASFRQQL